MLAFPHKNAENGFDCVVGVMQLTFHIISPIPHIADEIILHLHISCIFTVFLDAFMGAIWNPRDQT